MNILKGLGTFLLGFLLFLSLTVFGIAFLLHGTLLNPDFVAAQVDRIDVSELARDFTEQEIARNLPDEARFLEDAIYDVIDDQEPWLKEQLNYAIYTAYDFLLGETDTLEITVRLEELKEGLKESIWEAMNERLSTWLPDIVYDELRSYLDEHLQEIAAQIPEEYLPPEIVGLPEEQLLQYLDRYLKEIDEQITGQGLMPQVSGLLESLVKPYYDQYYDDFVEEIPSEIVIDESTIPAEVMEQLLAARKYIGYFQTGYYLLIVFMVLLVAGIFLINWNIGAAAMALSIDLLVYGALEIAAVFLARRFSPVDMLPDVAASMETWLSALFDDILSIMLTYSFAIFGVGIALLVVAIVFKLKASRRTDND